MVTHLGTNRLIEANALPLSQTAVIQYPTCTVEPVSPSNQLGDEQRSRRNKHNGSVDVWVYRWRTVVATASAAAHGPDAGGNEAKHYDRPSPMMTSKSASVPDGRDNRLSVLLLSLAP